MPPMSIGGGIIITFKLANTIFSSLVDFMVFNATFNNISAISWHSVLLVEETRGPGKNQRPVASQWQTLSHNVVHLALIRIQTHNISGDRHWFCICSCKSNYHMTTATMAPTLYVIAVLIQTWRQTILKNLSNNFCLCSLVVAFFFITSSLKLIFCSDMLRVSKNTCNFWINSCLSMASWNFSTLNYNNTI